MSDKTIFLAQQKLAIKVADVLNPRTKQMIMTKYEDKSTFLNSPCSIYEKDLVKKMMKENLFGKRMTTITSLFKQRQSSRFDFVNSNKESSKVEVPLCISDLIVHNIYKRESDGSAIINKESWLLDWEYFNLREFNNQASKVSENEEYILLNKFNSR